MLHRRFLCGAHVAGGDVVSALQCLEHRPFKAYAPVTYLYYNAQECRNAPAAPLICFHGTADFIVPFAGSGAPWFDPPVPEAMQSWAEHNGCSPQTIESSVSEDVLLYIWEGRESPVEWYKVVGGGHTWPGAAGIGLGLTTQDIDATSLIWKIFFKE